MEKSMTRSKVKHKDSEDAKMGRRLRVLRVMAGFSQTELGVRLPDKPISFQQIQKYEKGQNRISAVRLGHFAAILGAPITYFYEDHGKHYPKLSGFDRADATFHNFWKSIPRGPLRLGFTILYKALSELEKTRSVNKR